MQQASTTPGPSLQKKSEFSRKLPAINNILKENSINMFKRTLLFYSLSTCIYKVSRASKSSPQFSRATEQAKKSWRERERGEDFFPRERLWSSFGLEGEGEEEEAIGDSHLSKKKRRSKEKKVSLKFCPGERRRRGEKRVLSRCQF